MATTFNKSLVTGIGTTLTDVYTGATGKQNLVTSLTIINTTGTQVVAELHYNDVAGSVTAPIKKWTLAPDGSSSSHATTEKIAVIASDKLKVKSSAASSLNVLVSVSETA